VEREKMKRIALLIDGSNIYASAKSLGFRVDYKKLLDYFKRDCQVVRAFYFTALPDKNIESPLRKMVDFISYHGYTVIQKETREYTDEDGVPKRKGNMDVEIAVYAWKFAPMVDEIILFSGDGDFRALVERIQEVGVNCHVISTLKGSAPTIADSLRKQADRYTDLADLRGILEHLDKPRPMPKVHRFLGR
jgi:uncharacterized LabA/DUF88 family protein